MPQSALVVDVPEAEKYVAAIRERFDPSARLGARAHISLLYPFAEPGEIDASILNALEILFSKAPSFAFRLAAARRFPDTLYLAPDPAAPFVDLTRAIVARFPRHPPYGGQFATVVPHLTVARGSTDDLAFAEQRLSDTLADGIAARCREAVLIENASGRWRRMHSFPLAPAHAMDR